MNYDDPNLSCNHHPQSHRDVIAIELASSQQLSMTPDDWENRKTL